MTEREMRNAVRRQNMERINRLSNDEIRGLRGLVDTFLWMAYQRGNLETAIAEALELQAIAMIVVNDDGSLAMTAITDAPESERPDIETLFTALRETCTEIAAGAGCDTKTVASVASAVDDIIRKTKEKK